MSQDADIQVLTDEAAAATTQPNSSPDAANADAPPSAVPAHPPSNPSASIPNSTTRSPSERSRTASPPQTSFAKHCVATPTPADPPRNGDSRKGGSSASPETRNRLGEILLRASGSRLCRGTWELRRGNRTKRTPMNSTGPITRRPPLHPWSQPVQGAFSATWARAGKARMGRQKGVKCRPLQVNGGHWRTPENVAWPGAIARDQVRRTHSRRGSIPNLHEIVPLTRHIASRSSIMPWFPPASMANRICLELRKRDGAEGGTIPATPLERADTTGCQPSPGGEPLTDSSTSRFINRERLAAALTTPTWDFRGRMSIVDV